MDDFSIFILSMIIAFVLFMFGLGIGHSQLTEAMECTTFYIQGQKIPSNCLDYFDNEGGSEDYFKYIEEIKVTCQSMSATPSATKIQSR